MAMFVYAYGGSYIPHTMHHSIDMGIGDPINLETRDPNNLETTSLHLVMIAQLQTLLLHYFPAKSLC